MEFRSLVAVIFLPLLAFSQNLIVNPGAESAPLGNGWTAASGNWTQRHSSEYPPAYEGSYVFFAGPSDGEANYTRI